VVLAERHYRARLWPSALSDLNPCRRQIVQLCGVVPEIDIWRAAYLMLRWYGTTARQEGVRRANELTAVGDDVGVSVWRRIDDAWSSSRT
jgi:hypothetical protein